MTLDEAIDKIKKLEAKVKDFEDKGNKDTVTFFQLIGWSTAAFILGGILVWIF